MPYSPLRWRLFEWAQTALLAANLAWTTLCLGGYMARTMVVTSALTAALLFVHALGNLGPRPSPAGPGDGRAGAPALRRPGEGGPAPGPRTFHPAGWLFVPFLAYAAANVLCVTPVRWLGWFDWFGWAQMLTVFWVVLNGIRSPAAQRALWATLFAVAVVGVLFACYQQFVRPDWLVLHRFQAAQYLGRASGPFGIPNSFAGLLVLLLPMAAALAFRRDAAATARVFFGWLAVVLLFGLGLTISRGGWLALAAALSAWPLLAGLVATTCPPRALRRRSVSEGRPGSSAGSPVHGGAPRRREGSAVATSVSEWRLGGRAPNPAGVPPLTNPRREGSGVAPSVSEWRPGPPGSPEIGPRTPPSAGAGWGRRLLASAAAFGGIVLAGVATFLASPAVRDRFIQFAHEMGERSRPILWRAAWQLVREHPLVGSGAGSFDSEFERFRPEGFLNRPYWAHNDYLNTLSDFGTIGFLLFFGAAAFVVWRCLRCAYAPPGGPEAGPRAGLRPRARGEALADPLVRQAQAVGLLAFALHLLVEFHLEMPALALTFATVAALIVQRAWPTPSVARSSALEVEGSRLDVRPAPVRVPRSVMPFFRASGVPLLLAAAAVAMAVYVVPEYPAEALRQTARDEIDALSETPVTAVRYREAIADARERLDRAVILAPGNAQAWADRAYATAQAARGAPSQEKRLGAEAEQDANQALQRAPLCAEYWIRRGVARDLQGRWDAAGTDFARAIQLSPKLPLPWFHYAYHLALRRPGLAMADAMVEFCLRLDPKNPDALRLRQRLATGRPGP